MTIIGISFGQPPEAAKGMNPDEYAQQYANEHGCTLEDARQILAAQNGAPMPPSGGMQGGTVNTTTSDALSTGDVDGTGRQPSIPPEAMQLHQIYGIPLEVIQEGDNAIQQYAKENNITLPQKTTGNSLDFEG